MRAGYRADIDGLRAVAVGLVVLFHAFPTSVPGGFVGVDVFFVVSGYLITGIIQPSIEAGRFSFREFYARRVRRIFPALIIVLLATLALGWFLLLPNLYRQLGIHALAGAFFVPNFVFWNEVGYFDAAAATKPLLHLWSLGIEEQFYLVWPALLILLGRWRLWLVPSLAVLVGASFAYSAYASWHDTAAAFYSPFSRLWELGIGGLLAVYRPTFIRSEWPSIAGLLMILCSAFFLSESDPFPGLLALPAVAGAAVIVASGSRLLTIRPLVGIGLISYPLYLWHWPLLSFANAVEVSTPATRIVIIAGSVALSWLTYVAIEKPIRFGSMKRRATPTLLAGMASAGVLGGLIFIGAGLPVRYPVEIRPVLETMTYDPRVDARHKDCWIQPAAPIASFAPFCSEGSVLVWGDSFAGRFYAGLQTRLSPVAEYVRTSCPPLLVEENGSCWKGNFEIVEHIRKMRPRVVILFAAWTNYREDWAPNERYPTALRNSIRALKSAGVADVIVIGPAPVWDPFLPISVYNYWAAKGSLPDRLKPARRDYQLLIDSTIQLIAASEGARFVSVSDAICNRDGCLTHTGRARSDLISWDSGHFTTPGAQFVADALHIADMVKPGSASAP